MFTHRLLINVITLPIIGRFLTNERQFPSQGFNDVCPQKIYLVDYFIKLIIQHDRCFFPASEKIT